MGVLPLAQWVIVEGEEGSVAEGSGEAIVTFSP